MKINKIEFEKDVQEISDLVKPLTDKFKEKYGIQLGVYILENQDKFEEFKKKGLIVN